MILLAIASGLVAPQLPDTIDKFINQSVVTIEDQQYLFAEYTGVKNLASDYNVEDYLNSIEQGSQLIPVVIGQVTGNLPGYDDGERQYTVNENVDILATGNLPIPDQKFRVPFLRVDTGREQIMPAEVINGEFTITMNFKTGGKWVVNKDLLNSELPSPVFDIQEHTFFVI